MEGTPRFQGIFRPFMPNTLFSVIPTPTRSEALSAEIRKMVAPGPKILRSFVPSCHSQVAPLVVWIPLVWDLKPWF